MKDEKQQTVASPIKPVVSGELTSTISNGMSAVDLKITGDNLWGLIREAYRQGYLNGHHDAVTDQNLSSDEDVDDWLGEAMQENMVGDIENKAELI